ncbi:hypothetical protein ACI65C_005079 [Semiaphis heraclei]
MPQITMTSGTFPIAKLSGLVLRFLGTPITYVVKKNVYRQLEYDKPSSTTFSQMVKNHSEKNVYKQVEYDKPSSTTFSQMVKNHSEEKVRAWLTSEKNIHNSMEQDNEFNILDLTDADIVMLDSTPEKFHESAYNPDVLIEVPYNIVIQDIENVDQTPVISTNNSVIDISLQNIEFRIQDGHCAHNV